MNTAVLVIDMQRALCTGPEGAWDAGRVADNINGVLERARAAGAPVIMIQHEEDAGGLLYGSEGWQVWDAVAAAESDLHLPKRTCDSFLGTQLHAYLSNNGVRHLVICGLQTDFCIDTTVRRALGLGYDVTLVGDAHSTIDNGVLTPPLIVEHHNRVLGSLLNFGPRIEVRDAAQVAFA